MGIGENIQYFRNIIPQSVKLIAVSKTHPVSAILEAYGNGQRIFAENKAQDLCSKQPFLPDDIEWHFIGHLQSNKVKQIISSIHTLQSLDSLNLLRLVNNEALKAGKVIRCLLQFHIATEETKFGLDLDESRILLNVWKDEMMHNTIISGVMGMASLTDDESLIHSEFRRIHDLYDIIKREFFQGNHDFKEISIGMSGDYHIAIEEGSTMIRIGTGIFGDRVY